MTVRVAPANAQLARCLLHGLLGNAMGVHSIDIDRRLELACLHVELERGRVPDAMALLIRSLPGAEFGIIRQSNECVKDAYQRLQSIIKFISNRETYCVFVSLRGFEID